MFFPLPRTATEPFCPSETKGGVQVPPDLPFFRKLLRYAGPGLLVSVGYMDPGNWATDIEAGSRFGYGLLFVVLLASLWRCCCRRCACASAWWRSATWRNCAASVIRRP